jgi:hypothetical protein
MAPTPIAADDDINTMIMYVLPMTDLPTLDENDEEFELEEEGHNEAEQMEEEAPQVDKKNVLTNDHTINSNVSAAVDAVVDVDVDVDADVPLKKIAETRKEEAVLAAASAAASVAVEAQSTKDDNNSAQPAADAVVKLHKKEEEEEEQDDKKQDENEQEELQPAPAPKMRSLVDFKDEHDLRHALMRREDGTLAIKQKHKKNTRTRQDSSVSDGINSFCGHIFTGAANQNNEDEDNEDEYDSDLEDALLEAELDPNFDWMIHNLDAETSMEQTIEEELNRLQVLRSYLILDSEPEQAFERITALATRMFNVPIANVTLIDLGREWFMSNRGLGDLREIPRKITFCGHTILSTQDIMVVPNTHDDFRFKDAPLVAMLPHIEFYAGCPLVSPEGVKLGTFWYVALLLYIIAGIYIDVHMH